MPATVVPAREYEESYLAAFAARSRELPGLADLRRRAAERFSELGFPTTHHEDWRFTNLAPFLKTPFAPGPAGAPASWRPDVAPAGPVLTFVNGRLAPGLSRIEKASGLKISSLRDAIGDPRIAATALFEKNALAALNTAMFEDGAFVEIPAGTIVEQPVTLLYLTLSGQPAAAYPRNLIVAGRESQASVVEMYLDGGGSPAFTNAVTELLAGDGAVVNHYKYQDERRDALHYGMLAIRQGASSSVTSHNIAVGAALARNEITVVLDGEGADCVLNGLYVTTGEQHVDNHTTLDHAKPHCTSHELYKGILDGKARGVFHGRIVVRPEAQKTDAIQRNKNLLLSKDAVINTKPQLEIYADDVKCTHGATVGQVDHDAVFYLRSRGIPLEEARALLTYAFTADVVDRIAVEWLREKVHRAMADQLKGSVQ